MENLSRKMRTLARMVVFLTLALATKSFSKEGHGGGNGGGAHVCENGEIDMYDIVEGEIRYGLEAEISEFDGKSEEEILSVVIGKVRKASNWLAEKIEAELNYVNANLRVLKNIQLKELPDANILFTRKNCKYVQLANWDDSTGKILVDQSIYESEKFNSPLKRSYLKYHESAYKVARDFGALNSDAVRRFVAESFSKSKIVASIVPNQFDYKLKEEKTKYYSCIDLYMSRIDQKGEHIFISMFSSIPLAAAAAHLSLPVAFGVLAIDGAIVLYNGIFKFKEIRSLNLNDETKNSFKRIVRRVQEINPALTSKDVSTIISNGFKTGDFCQTPSHGFGFYGPRQIKDYVFAKAKALQTK
ncbi:MAG: hypothetical protein QE271_04010 [Bacteriovoracaceae bacterium]|nr:hypothetical protein [Bacteriovoracaceae bacterium]